MFRGKKIKRKYLHAVSMFLLSTLQFKYYYPRTKWFYTITIVTKHHGMQILFCDKHEYKMKNIYWVLLTNNTNSKCDDKNYNTFKMWLQKNNVKKTYMEYCQDGLFKIKSSLINFSSFPYFTSVWNRMSIKQI